jgi:hypothetical protein
VVKTAFFVGGGSVRILGAAWALGALPGCYDVKTVGLGVEVMPEKTGRVDMNDLNVHGQWFAYGDDGFYPQACTSIGQHAAATCSAVLLPAPLPSLGFPNYEGLMCTSGSIGEVLPCKADEVPNCADGKDYSNMWGAGIGLDFGLAPTDARDPLQRTAWNAPAHGVTGVAFDLTLFDDGGLGGPYLRIEFPMQLPASERVPPGEVSISLKQGKPGDQPVIVTGAKDWSTRFPDDPIIPSEEYPSGSPYWGAPQSFKDAGAALSPVRVGHNVIHFRDTIRAPDSHYDFDPTQLLGIDFHVPSFAPDTYVGVDMTAGVHFTYGFCISNLTFLRE